MPDTTDSHPLAVRVDLTNCDREPIHLLGGVQAHGVLIALTSDWIVAHASANAALLLGRGPADLLGVNLASVLPAATVRALRAALTSLQGGASVERRFGLDVAGDGRAWDLAVHASGGTLIFEFEPSEPEADLDAAATVRSLVARLQRREGFDAFCQEAARQMRALTGFDRVMVYRFHPDGTGEVIAEAHRAGIDSFLGLRYPASDIPRQARALYLRSWLRIIPDVAAEPSPIVPPTDPRGEPLDLSLSVLRSVSPIHVEYLRNMGVGASMSVSILRGGRLWGLFACHHYGPHRIGFARRTAAELFGQMASLLLESRERGEEQAYEARSRQLHDQLMSAMAAEASAFENVSEVARAMGELIPCDGVAAWVDGRVTLIGSTPDERELEGVVRVLNRAAASGVFATDSIGPLHEPGRAFAERAAGMLAIPVSRRPRDYVIFFRREVAQTVTWAGNPEKPVTAGPNGARLTPRKSFEAWQEVVRGRSAPWTEAELRVAESFRITLLEVILRLSDQAEDERRGAAERQELLIAELNHRVRNILALIRGLVAQTRSGVRSVEEFAQVLGGRVQALARAHDQLTEDQWGPAPLRPLIEAEAAAYLTGQARRVELEGPDVQLDPRAYSTLALVVHELMTNSAKHGALCDKRGRVRVRWEVVPGGDLAIHWDEMDGPAVQAPTRRGFGSTIIERSIPHELRGEAQVEYRLAGVRARFRIPAAMVSEKPAPPADPAPPRSAPEARLSGRALLVEDNMVIALDAEEMLLDLGAETVDQASGVGAALALIEANPPAFAMLDVNLGEETSFAVADRLRELGVPHVFATGYGEEARFPEAHRDTPVIKKPYGVEALAGLLGRTPGPRAR